jgi:hypothetical protein
MAIAHIRALGCVALVFLTVVGRVIDETSRLPLGGVRVHAEGATRADTTTDRQGNFRIKDLKPGPYVVTTQSGNVPSQVFFVKVDGSATMHLLRVCEEDEACGPPKFGGGGHP